MLKGCENFYTAPFIKFVANVILNWIRFNFFAVADLNDLSADKCCCGICIQ